MKHKTLRTLLCVILTVCFCLSAIAPVSAAGLFSGDTGAASIFDEWIRSLKDRFIEKNPGTDETPAENETAAGTDGFEYKIVFLDCGRKYFSVDSIKTIIDNAAAAGFNYVQLAVGNDGMRFLLDDMSLTVNGVTYSHNDVSAAIHAGNEAYYNFTTDELTQTEMDTIIAYAKEKGIGIIPCVNTPGHMDAILDAAEALTKTTCSYNGSGRTIDVTNDTAVAFTQAFVQKYINYFAGKGCNLFNMGADEYANDIYTSGSMGFGNLQSTGKYKYYVNYVNDLATMIKDAGMTPMAFNDGIYFNNNTYSGTFDTDIIICYWSNGWSSYTPMPATTLAGMGFKLVNTHGDYYWVLGKSDWQCSPAKASGFNYRAFQGGTIDNPAGAMFCIWCDYPGAGTETSVLNSTKETIAAFGKTLPDVTPAAPTISGIKDGGNLAIGSSVTLSVSGGADATWTSSDTSVLNLEAVTGDAAAAAVGTVIAQSVKVTALKKGSATVTAATADGKTASATIQVYEEGDPNTVYVTVAAGETTDPIRYADGDKSGDTISYEVEGNVTATLTPVKETSVDPVETPLTSLTSNTEFYIKTSSGEYFTSSGGTTTDANKAQKWKWSNNKLSYDSNGSTNYLSYASNGWGGSYSTTTYESYAASAYFNEGSLYRDRYETWEYIYYNEIGTPVSITFPTPTIAYTNVIFTGIVAGTTTNVHIGDKLYVVTVTDKAQDGSMTATSIDLEYWITNNMVYDGKSTYTNHTKTITQTTAGATNEEGVDIATLAPNPAYSFFDGTVTLYYWQTMRLDSAHKQTVEAGVDRTADGTALTHVRYHSGAWQYKTVDGTWHYFMIGDQLVAYYLQKTEVTKEIDTYVKDWGYGTSSTTPDTSSYKGQVALTVAVVYPDGSVSPTEANMYANSTTIFNYWDGRDIGIVAPTNNSDYTISKITVTDGSRVSNTSANVWYSTDSIKWNPKTRDDGTQWYDETEVWNKSSGTTPMVNGKASNITWSAKNKGKLVLIYLEIVQKDTNLNVVYWDNHANTQINPNPIQVVVSDGVTFTNGLKNSTGDVIGNKAEWKSNDKTSSDYLPDDAYVTNSSGVDQTFSKELGNMAGVPSGYTSGLYAYQYAKISEDGKTLTLFYDISATTYVKNYVVDYGMKITISGLASWLDVNKDVVKLSVAKGTISQDRQGLYGRAIIDQTNDTLTYEINKPMMATAVIPIYVYSTKDADSSEAVLKGTINVIPATNVYYEESFLTTGKDKAEGGSSWTTGGNATNGAQTLENAGTNIYVHGFDPIYNSETTFSKGGYMTATLQKPTVSYGVLTNDYLSFTFNGTGYDVVSECGPNTGMLWVERWLGNQCKKITIVDTSFYGDNTFVTGGEGVLAYQIPVVRELDLTRDKYEIRIYGYSLASAGAFTGGQNNTNAAEASRYSLAPVADTFAMEDDSFYSILAAHGIDMDEVEVEFTSMQNNSEVAVYAATAKAAKLDAVAEVQYDSSSTATTSVVYVDAFRVYQPIADESKYDTVEQGEKYASVYDYVKNGQTIATGYIENSAVYVEYDGNGKVTQVGNIQEYPNGGPQNEVYLTSSSDGISNYVGMILDGWNEQTSHLMVSAKIISGDPVLEDIDSTSSINLTSKTELYYDVTEWVKQDTTTNDWYIILGNNSSANSVLSISALKIVNATATTNRAFLSRMATYIHTPDVTENFVPETFLVTENVTIRAGKTVNIRVQFGEDVKSFALYEDADMTKVVEYSSNPRWNNKKAYENGKNKLKNYTAYIKAPTEPGEYTYYMAAFDADGNRSAPVKVVVTVTE